MGYTDDKRNIGELISLTSNGINVPSFVQIRDALISIYRNLYGSDIDVDTVSVDGQFIHSEAQMINNIMLALNKIQNGLNPNTATGNQLDTICAMSGV